MSLEMMYITNNPEVAIMAEKAGVDRIWIDLEKMGKKERQKGMNTVQSNHTLDDILTIKSILNKARLQVRVNPINKLSKMEIDTAIKNGADIIMLPMFKTILEVEKFITYVDRRALTLLLLETKEAENIIDELLLIKGIDEIHIGLNDLHLSHNLQFMFELLQGGEDSVVGRLGKKIGQHNIPYGFGGIARIGEGMLPAEYILAEHYYLKSTRVILSRSFFNENELINNEIMQSVFVSELNKIRNMEAELANKDVSFFRENHRIVEEKIKEIVNYIGGGNKTK